MKEATCPRRRTVISCRGLDWAAMALLFCRKLNVSVERIAVESQKRGIWLDERLPRLNYSISTQTSGNMEPSNSQ
jgi:hypothetical protein